jgi:molecular chaperone DnaK (HSP70)
MTLHVYEGPSKVAPKNKEFATFTVRGIPPAEAEEMKVTVKFLLEIDGILNVKACVKSGGAQPVTLRVTKSTQLFGGERVMRTSSDRAREKIKDEQRADKTWRRAEMELLSRNLRRFLANESEKNSQFDRLVPPAERPSLQAIADRKLATTLGRLPTWSEIENAKRDLRNSLALSKYFASERNGFPRWLEKR